MLDSQYYTLIRGGVEKEKLVKMEWKGIRHVKLVEVVGTTMLHKKEMVERG